MVIKRLISGFIGVFVATSSVFALDDVPPLRVYMFSPEVMEEVSNEFFADKVIKTEDGKSEVNEVYLYLLNRAADEPTSLQDGECHGCVSGTDIVKACIAGGLTRVNSSKTNDFQRCVDFYLALCEKQEIEAQWDFAQCPPAFDENKKRQNMLTSLTEETRIGDVCGNTPDTNISYGFVTLRKGGYSGQDRYVCTCTAFRCKPGHWMNKKTYQCQEKDPNGNFTEFQLSGTYSYQQFAPKQVEQSLDLDIKPLKSFNYSESIRIKDENLVKQDNTRVVNQTVEMTKAQISAMEPYEQQKKDINSKIMEIGKAKSEILEIYVSANQEALRKCASDYPSVINKEGGVKIENNVFAGALAVPLDMTKDIEEAVKGNFYIVCNPNSTTVNLYMNFIQRINDLYADKLKDLQEAKDMLDIQINAVWNTGKSPCYNNDANCIRVFKDIETMQPDKACYLAERYAAIQMKKIVRCVDMNGACSAYKGKGNQDFVQCTAADGTKYEFEFDDAFGVNGVEGGDDHRAVFGIVYKGQVESYGWKKAGNQYTGSYEVFELKIKNKGNTYEDDCFNMIHDYEMVAAFDDQRFGLNNTEPGKCEFVKAYKDTNAYGINPTVFCSGATQFDFHSNSELSSWLEKYVADKAGVNINKVDCKSEIRWNDYCGGNNVRDKMKGREDWGRCGTPPACDDVKVCYVTDGGNKQKVSFVFDDLNQIFKAETYDKGARESFQCIVSGGTFDGYGCHFANESQCNDFAKGLKSICPDCKAPKWNPSIERCELQDAADMTWWSHGVRYMQIAGGFVFATAITIITGGGGSVTYALVLVEAGGAAIEIKTQMEIWEQPNEFIKKSKACHEVKCAKEYIDNYLNYFGNYSDWEYQGQVDIVDAEMARLLEIIEKDEASMTEFSKNYAKEVGWFKEGGIQGKETHLWNPNDWNADQAWRALGITMQFATMGTGVLTRLLGKSGKLAGKLSKTEQVLQGMTKKAKTGENVAGLAGTADNIQLDKVSEIVLRNKKIAKEQMAYVRQVYNSGPEGKKWVELWDKHAPRNQSLKDFQDAFKNDLRGTEEYFEKFSEEARRKRGGELTLAYQQKYGNTYADYEKIRSANQAEAIKNGKPVERLTPKTKGLESWTQEQIDAADEIYWAEWESGWVKNRELYSTYDPAVTNIKNEFKSSEEALDKEYDELVENYRKQHGTYTGFEDSPEYKELNKRYDDMREQYQYRMAESVPLPNLDINARRVANNFDNILAENADLAHRFDRWDKLSMNEKESLFQDLLNAYAAKYGTPKISVRSVQVPVREDGFLEYGHYYDGTFYINTLDVSTWQGPSRELALQAVAHEYSHAIDHISPNLGSVGQQLMKQGPYLYTNKGPSYPLSLTEQSSYATGGMIDARGNWPLENAVRAQGNAIKAQENAVKAQQLQGHFEKLKQIGYDRDIAHKFTFINSQDLEQALLSGKMREYTNNILNKVEEIEKYIKNNGDWSYGNNVAGWCSSLRKMLHSLEEMGDIGYKYGAKPAETLTEILQRFGMDRSYLSQKIFSGDKYAIEQFAKNWESNLAEIREKFNVALYNNGDDFIDLMNISKDIDKADSYIWKMKGENTGIIDIDELKKLIVQ